MDGEAADSQQQKHHDERHAGRPGKMGCNTRKQVARRPDSTSKEDYQKGEIMSQSAIADNMQLTSKALHSKRIAASQSNKGRE